MTTAIEHPSATEHYQRATEHYQRAAESYQEARNGWFMVAGLIALAVVVDVARSSNKAGKGRRR